MRNYVLLVAYVFVLLCLLVGHWSAKAQEVRTRLACETGCVEGAVRKGFTRLIFLNGRVDPDNSRLECSVYKNGFEIGGYAFFVPLIADPEKLPQPVRREIAQLRPFKIHISDVKTATDERHIKSVTVVGVEPGLNYSWRLSQKHNDKWISSEVVRCPAPVCIHDGK